MNKLFKDCLKKVWLFWERIKLAIITRTVVFDAYASESLLNIVEETALPVVKEYPFHAIAIDILKEYNQGTVGKAQIEQASTLANMATWELRETDDDTLYYASSAISTLVFATMKSTVHNVNVVPLLQLVLFYCFYIKTETYR